jgi:hypothetical protein
MLARRRPRRLIEHHRGGHGLARTVVADTRPSEFATLQECVTGPVPAATDDLNGVAGEPPPFWVAAARTAHRSEPAQRQGNDPEMPRERNPL